MSYSPNKKFLVGARRAEIELSKGYDYLEFG